MHAVALVTTTVTVVLDTTTHAATVVLDTTTHATGPAGTPANARGTAPTSAYRIAA